jgi:hypothetical protein
MSIYGTTENLEAINENIQWAALITVYRPNPERWINKHLVSSTLIITALY